MERISASRSHPFFSKGTKCAFAISSSSSLVAGSDGTGGVITSCPTSRNTVLYFGTWEIGFKSDSSLLHIYHLGTIKIRKQQEVLLLGKIQSSLFWCLRLSLSHHLLGPTIFPDVYTIVVFIPVAVIKWHMSPLRGGWGSGGLCPTHLWMLSSYSIAFWLFP